MYYRPQPTQKKPALRKSELKKFDAPTSGWISNRNLASPMSQGQSQGAAVLDNFFPTSTTALLRRGKEVYATLGDASLPVTSMFVYVNGLNAHLFASTENTIYDITNVTNPTNWMLVDAEDNFIVTEDGDTFGINSTADMFEVYENTTGGEWVTVQFSTTGGVYLIGVNGESTGFIYDGYDFYPYVKGGVNRLGFDTVTTPFELGEVITGATSGAKGTIYKIESGNLYLTDVTGTFQDNEVIDGDEGGKAVVNGTISNVVPGIDFGTGRTSADMSYVWAYKNRLWFIQKDSLNSWYMDAPDAVGGTPKIYPLSGILSLGGSLLWGSAWAIGTGAAGGLSDQMVITSTEGEVAVFQGSYPEASNDWKGVGVYRIGTPLGKYAHFRGGGDIAVATSVGLIPLSKAIELDVTALSPASVSYNIQDAWRDALEGRGREGWVCKLWPDMKMAIISPPVTIGTYDPVLFVSNTETGAWCRFTNWDARAMEVFQGQLYFGGPEGAIYKANVTGADDGAAYTGIYIPLFDDLGSPASKKIPKMGRGVARSKGGISYSLMFRGDFNINTGAAPSATFVDSQSLWGGGEWGKSVWGAERPDTVSTDWKSLGGLGYSTSLCFQVTSGSIGFLDVEIIRLEMTYTTAELVT